MSVPTSRIEPQRALAPRAQGQQGRPLDFQSLVSSLNPIMHVPVIGDIYSATTGDRPIPAVRIFVATLLAGPVGLFASIANSVVEEATGKSLVGQAIAALAPETVASPMPVAGAATAPPGAPRP